MNQSVTELIKRRFSCRRHPDSPIEEQSRLQLEKFINSHQTGPFGSPTRFILIAATDNDRQTLKGVGTYGFIKNAQGFIVGAVGPGGKNLEDFGYAMEQAILFATGLGIGTCWLGGSFTKSGFAKKIAAGPGETVPAVTSIGYVADRSKAEDWIRRRAGGSARLPAEQMFFEEKFGNAIRMEAVGDYAQVLDLVRWGPSASNKQPWRIVHSGTAWHFYLQRTKGYGPDSMLGKVLKVSDVQRLDMGIAMCHFEMSAGELGLNGRWVIAEPDIARPDIHTEYTVSWESAE